MQMFRPPLTAKLIALTLLFCTGVAIAQDGVDKVKYTRLVVPVTLSVNVTTVKPVLHGPLEVQYELRNQTVAPLGGYLVARFGSAKLRSNSRTSPLQPNVSIAPGGRQTGTFRIDAIPAFGRMSLQVQYVQNRVCRDVSTTGHFRPPVCEIGGGASAVLPIDVSLDPQTASDQDGDGIPDLVEAALLERFRPYFRFTDDDDYRPTDAEQYIRLSELHGRGRQGEDTVVFGNADLRDAPERVLFELTDLNKTPAQTSFKINPLAKVEGNESDEPGRHGSSWSEVESRRNIGLYGHVAPLRLPSEAWSCESRWNFAAGSASDPLYYVVEYWQFFGFNDSGSFGIGQHEGDWTAVRLLVRPPPAGAIGPGGNVDLTRLALVAVMHYAHGLEWRFDLASATRATEAEDDGKVQELRGPHAGETVFVGATPGLGVNKQCETYVQSGQNNRLRLYQDDDTKLFTHPVVYVEKGSHEFWPTEDGDFVGAASHSGRGSHHFLAATPPNLGEVEAPTAAGRVIAVFNGRWGKDTSAGGDPAQGPPLHDQWTYPACVPDALVRHCVVGPSVQKSGHGY